MKNGKALSLLVIVCCILFAASAFSACGLKDQGDIGESLYSESIPQQSETTESTSEGDKSEESGAEEIIEAGFIFKKLEDETYTVKKYTGTDSEITIPSMIRDVAVTKIGNSAFLNCNSLTKIEIPNSIKYVGSFSFAGCDNLQYNVKNGLKYLGNEGNPYLCLVGSEADITTATIENTCKIIAGTVFYLSSLEEVIIPDSVITIGDEAFYYCSRLKEIVIPDSVKSIGYYAFGWCKSLTEIVIPDSVTNIENCAFSYCDGVNSISIGCGVTDIGDFVFSNCRKLIKIAVNENNQLYKDIDGNLYTKDGKTLIQYAVGKKNTAFSIPETVTSIEYEAFCECISLTNVTIPSSVSSIDMFAFEHCDRLTDIYYKGTKKTWDNIEIASDNTYLTDAQKYYYSESEPALDETGTAYDGNYWRYVDGEPTVWVYVKTEE